MDPKKKYVILVLCIVAFVGIFFGVLQFSKTKKTIEVSVENSKVNDIQQEDIIENQKEGISDQPAPLVDEQPIISKKEEKVIEQATKEKVAVEKTVEPEKQTEAKTQIKGDGGKVVDRLISWGFTKSTERKIDTVIVHSSYDALGSDPYSVSGIIAEYKQYEVSAHYLIARDGIIYRLVADDNIAWHAGVAKMPDGRTNVNSFSIGVEMINTETGKYANEQYEALNRLIGDLGKKYAIKNILGHNEIAPGRKTDPWGIEWKKINR